MKTLNILLLLCLSLLLAACSSTQPTTLQNDPYYAPAVPPMPRQKLASDGAIFQPQTASSIYSDVKARRVGDIITVTLQENTNATKRAGSANSRESDASIKPMVGLGGENIRIGNQSIQMGIGSSSDFAGNASANQSNSLTGSISVTVIQVLPNNNLVVRGEKWLTLNNGDEYIRLTGIVRPADISPVNEIASNKVANARIQYSGTGTFSEAQQQGWLTRFFNSSWWPL